MFDRCRGWRRQLTRRADGSLPMAQWGALEDHLARCPQCHAAAEADAALRDVCRIHTGVLDDASAESFDDRVLEALRGTGTPAFAAPVHEPTGFLARWRAALPFGFLTQITGGAVVAAGITALCLSATLRPAAPSARGNNGGNGHSARSMAARNEPPVPLESLLRTPSPRAALLWTTPANAPTDRSQSSQNPAPDANAPRATSPTVAPHAAEPAAPRHAGPDDTNEHGSVLRGVVLG